MGKIVAVALVAMGGLIIWGLVRSSGPSPTPSQASPAPSTAARNNRDVYTPPPPTPPETDSREGLSAYNEGLAAYRQGDWEAAAAHFQDAVRELPENAAANEFVALSLMHMGETDDAISWMERAYELVPEDYDRLDNLVTMYKQANQLEDAADRLRGFLNAVDEDDEDVRLELARLSRTLGDNEEALRHAEILAERFGDKAVYVYEYGVSLQAAGRLDEARETLRNAIDLDPNSGPAHHALGVAELLSGNTEQAVQPLQEAVARDPSNGAFHFSLAQTYEKLDRIPESLASYEEYLKFADPSDPKTEVVRRQLKIAKEAWAEQEKAGRSGGGTSGL